MEKKYFLPECGFEVVLGKFAEQADGAVWIKQEGTIVLATAVSAPSKEFPGFLPLTIDYREQFAAAGKIPGGYFKREGKSSDKEVLVGRIIDRSVRPLFPANYFNQVQILATVYSVDKEHMPGPLALVASSLALTISKIPFMGPVGAVEIARIDNEFIYNPTYSQTLKSDLRIMVVGTDEGICMVEGSANELSEADFLDVMFKAHDLIKKQVAWQLEIQKEIGLPKEEIVDQFDWQDWKKKAADFLKEAGVDALFTNSKEDREKVLDALKSNFFTRFEQEAESLEISRTFLEFVFDDVLKTVITDYIFEHNKRLDLRSFDAVRTITTEVGLLPFNHGSALFQRGATQALVSVTLGGGQDEQRIEDLMGESPDVSFMLHYNFPPFSVGEVRPVRGPGRREVGHGHLAASALKAVLPSKEKFGYTIRIVSDILSSDGSSSMATTCGSVMALMNAGVPISKMVSGVAMGLLVNKSGDRFQVLTDIAGLEDAFGLMDFKVAGTQEGITAIQMDIKYKGGIKREVFEQALAAAHAGRIHILGEMRKVMTAPNPTLSELVPQIVLFKIPTNKIGAVIGSGGKIIREIIDKTGTSIDIEDDGMVKIFGHPGPLLDQAVSWVKVLGGSIDRGTIFAGKVKKIAEFGLFVEIAPGLDGLVHVSNLPRAIQSTFSKVFKPEDPAKVEVVDYDESTGRIRLRLVE